MTQAVVTVEAAGDALYTAHKAAQQAPDLARAGDGSGDFRTSFIQAFRTLAVYVAEADGQLSAAERTAIEQMFWLDRADPDATSRANAADPDAIETAIRYLATMVDSVSEADRLFGRPADAGSNTVCLAAEKVFRCMLAADGASSLDTQRSEAVMARLTADLPTRAIVVQTAEPPSVPVVDQDSIAAAPAAGSEPMMVPVPCPARLHDGESCYATTPAVLFQASNVVRNVRYRGLSTRVGIIKGLSYRSGSYDVDRTREAKVERIAEGTLCVTDQRLIFLSDVKNLDLPLARLLSSETGPGAIAVTRSSSGQIMFDGLDPNAVEVFEQLTGTSPDQRLRLEADQSRPPPARRRLAAPLMALALMVVVVLAAVFR